MLLAHADWSVDARKRWVAFGRRLADGRYEVGAPAPVGPLPSFFARLREREPSTPVFAGFDFPIGLPRAYAERARIGDFMATLCLFGSGVWLDFYEPAESPAEISLTRPFYPKRPGGTGKEQLIRGLGLESASDLLRVCDRATEGRNKACEIFWTLGANQVGRAAIEGWRNLLAPAVRQRTVSLWPFQGELHELLAPGVTVVAETYPAETYGHIGLEKNFGKRNGAARQKQAGAILGWCGRNGVELTAEARWDVEAGFGSSADGEDRFDSFVGLLGMIEVVRCPAKAAIPPDAFVRSVEGWILGMSPAPHTARPAGFLCPACGQKRFASWPSGWDGHAAHKCPGVQGATPEERKAVFKARYLS